MNYTTDNKWTAEDVIAEYLKAAGIKLVTELPGQGDAYFFKAIQKRSNRYQGGQAVRTGHFDLQLMEHEGALAHVLDHYTRASGGMIGAMSVTEGVGLAQASMGLRNLLIDGIPAFVHIGQVTEETATPAFASSPDARHWSQGQYPGRLNPQDSKGADATMLLNEKIPFVKAVFHPTSMDDVIKMMPEAIKALKSGRPGPVVFDVPRNVAKQTIEPFSVYLPPEVVDPEPIHPQDAAVDAFIEKIKNAEKPMLVFGELMKAAGPEAYKLAKELAELTGAVVTTSFRQFDCFDNRHSSFGGSFGLITPPPVSQAYEECDKVFSIGHWIGGEMTEQFRPDYFKGKDLTLVYNHQETFEHGMRPPQFDVVNNNVYRPDLTVESDMLPFLRRAVTRLKEQHYGEPEWRSGRKDWRDGAHRKYLAFAEVPVNAVKKDVDMPYIVRQLFEHLKKNYDHFFISNDSGGNAAYFPFQEYDRPSMHGAAAMGSVGYTVGDIGAAWGMRHTGREGPVVSTVGDLGFNMYGMVKLVAMANAWLDARIATHTVIVNNNASGGIHNTIVGLGLGRDNEELFRDTPAYASMVKAAYGGKVQSATVTTTTGFLPVLGRLLADEKSRPSVMDLKIPSAQGPGGGRGKD